MVGNHKADDRQQDGWPVDLCKFANGLFFAFSPHQPSLLVQDHISTNVAQIRFSSLPVNKVNASPNFPSRGSGFQPRFGPQAGKPHRVTFGQRKPGPSLHSGIFDGPGQVSMALLVYMSSGFGVLTYQKFQITNHKYQINHNDQIRNSKSVLVIEYLPCGMPPVGGPVEAGFHRVKI